MIRKKGFTIAEVLVALTTIAVLAALVMPSLNKIKPNQEMLMLKKVYYLVGRTVNELVNDDDFYPDADTEAGSGFSHVNTTPPARYHGQDYEGPTKFCGLFAARMNVRGNINCDAEVTKENTFVNGSVPGHGHFTTADGVVWVLPINAFPGIESIYVDVNGLKPGNCFPDSGCTNPDRFEIKVDRFGRLYVDDEITRKYLALSDTTKTYQEVKDLNDPTQ